MEKQQEQFASPTNRQFPSSGTGMERFALHHLHPRDDTDGAVDSTAWNVLPTRVTAPAVVKMTWRKL